MDKKRKKYIKTGLHCLVIFLALLSIFYFLKAKYINEGAESFTWDDIAAESTQNENYTFTERTGELSQTFECTTDILWGIRLRFERHQNHRSGTVEFVVEDGQGGIVCQTVMPVSSLDNEKPFVLLFDHLEEEARGKTFVLRIKVTDLNPEDKLMVSTSSKWIFTPSSLADSSKELKGNLQMGQIYGQYSSLGKLFWIFALVVTIAVYGLYFCLFIKKVRLERVFIGAVLFTGMAYVVLMKPGIIPDEGAHYRSAYAYSNVVLGEGNGVNDPVVMRDEDISFYKRMARAVPDPFEYQRMLSQFGRSAGSNEMRAIDKCPVQAPGFLYFPGAAGITIGRLLNLNALTVFYLGRIVNLLAFVLMAYWAVKKMPFYKMSMFAIIMLPMTAQLMGSYSYDIVIIGLALMLVAAILDYAYGQAKGAKDLIVIATLSILLGCSKAGAYIPLCALVWLIPQKKFATKKNRLLFVGGTLLGTVLVCVLASMGQVSSSIGADRQVIADVAEAGYTIGWVFRNPKEFILLLLNTVYKEGDFIFSSLIGKDLGWFNYPVQMVVVIGFLLVFLLSATHVSGGENGIVVGGKAKIGILIGIVISGGIIAAAMLLSWTLLSSKSIQGIQGRYFIPLLLPLVLCLKNHTLVLKRSIDRGLIFALGWLQVLTWVNVLITPLSKLLEG